MRGPQRAPGGAGVGVAERKDVRAERLHPSVSARALLVPFWAEFMPNSARKSSAAAGRGEGLYTLGIGPPQGGER